MNNQEIAQLLRNMAAAYEVLGENRFKVISYRRAADNVERLTGELKDTWDEGKLKDIPGIGANIAQHLDELFRKGKVAHFRKLMKKVPPAMFVFLKLTGVGAKTAYKLAKEFYNKSYKPYKTYKEVLKTLEKAIKEHKICQLEGFGEKREQEILEAIHEYHRGERREKRILLAYADETAWKVISYLKQLPAVFRVDPLGSLRRRVATVGDIDIAVSTNKPANIIEHFLKYPKKRKTVEKGEKGATLITDNGVQVDLRVSDPSGYGAMLQYFTGSKTHNIALRELALKKGLSLSEYGIKKVKSLKSKVKSFKEEEEFYKYLGLGWIPPELREAQGEIKAAIDSKLPKLVEEKDIKGDLHIHSSYEMPVSHDLGTSSLDEILAEAERLEYEYIGLSDHNPKQTGLSANMISQILKRRKQFFEQKLYGTKSVQKFSRTQKVYIMLEIDLKPNGNLALPERAFEYIDAVIVSIHSSFRMNRTNMTKRIIKGLSYPKVKVLGHPTARMIGQRESIEANWEKIFTFCKEKNIALEINSWPGRLDLPDFLVREAVKIGVKLIINTDSHEVKEMKFINYGVSVGRRGWATKDDIINTLPLEGFEKWLIKRK